METLLGIFAIIGAAVIFGVILNPYFWQGFRNTKFWDEQSRAKKNTRSRDLIDPDNKEI